MIETSPSATTSATIVGAGTTSTPTSVGPAQSLYAWPVDFPVEEADFWHGAKIAGFEIPHFSSVEPLADWATFVVVGSAVGIGPSIALRGDPDNNETTSSFTVEIQVKEVIRSRADLFAIDQLHAGDRILVIVDRRPRGEIPEGLALFFLQSPEDPRYIWHRDLSSVPAEYRAILEENYQRWNEFLVGKYQLVNSQSVLIGDAQSTVNPMRPPYDDLLAETISNTPISEVAEAIRSMPAPELCVGGPPVQPSC